MTAPMMKGWIGAPPAATALPAPVQAAMDYLARQMAALSAAVEAYEGTTADRWDYAEAVGALGACARDAVDAYTVALIEANKATKRRATSPKAA